MFKKYNVFIKRTIDGKIEKTLLISAGFNFYACTLQLLFILFVYLFYLKKNKIAILFIFSIVFIFLYPINILFSIIIGFKFNYFLSKMYIKSGYEYLGWTTGKSKQEAKQKFIDGASK